MRKPTDSENACVDAYWLLLRGEATDLALAKAILKPIVEEVEEECEVENYSIDRENGPLPGTAFSNHLRSH